MCRLLFVFLFLLSFGCGEVEVLDRESCSTFSEDYIYTSFDCGDYSVDYRFCNGDDSDCVDFAPEAIMGHCKSANICA